MISTTDYKTVSTSLGILNECDIAIRDLLHDINSNAYTLATNKNNRTNIDIDFLERYNSISSTSYLAYSSRYPDERTNGYIDELTRSLQRHVLRNYGFDNIDAFLSAYGIMVYTYFADISNRNEFTVSNYNVEA
jgi:hypothetical protein